MDRELYARHVVEKKLSNILQTHLQRDYVSELIDRYFQNIIDVTQRTFGAKSAAAPLNSLRYLSAFSHLTPLIGVADRLRWAEQIPRYEPNRVQTVVLRRRSTQIEFGFQIRGGYDQQQQQQAIYDNDDELDDDTGYGFYIDHVVPNSIAWNAGRLLAGQRILSIDNLSLRRTTMSELLMYIDQRLCITLRVTNDGLLPVREDESAAPLEWQYSEQYERALTRPSLSAQQQFYQRPLSVVSVREQERALSTTLCKIRDEQTISKYYYYGTDVSKKEQRRRRQLKSLPVRVCILDTHGAPLGITVVGRSGRVDKGGGLFVADVERDSLADRAGLHAGDRILEINGHIVETVDSTLTDDWLTGKSVTLGSYDRQFPKFTRKERDRWSRRFCSFDEALAMLRNCRTLDLRITKS